MILVFEVQGRPLLWDTEAQVNDITSDLKRWSVWDRCCRPWILEIGGGQLESDLSRLAGLQEGSHPNFDFHYLLTVPLCLSPPLRFL
jgi:hypothetical protein